MGRSKTINNKNRPTAKRNMFNENNVKKRDDDTEQKYSNSNLHKNKQHNSRFN